MWGELLGIRRPVGAVRLIPFNKNDHTQVITTSQYILTNLAVKALPKSNLFSSSVDLNRRVLTCPPWPFLLCVEPHALIVDVEEMDVTLAGAGQQTLSCARSGLLRDEPIYEYGSKLNHQGTAGFSASFHLTGFHL